MEAPAEDEHLRASEAGEEASETWTEPRVLEAAVGEGELHAGLADGPSVSYRYETEFPFNRHHDSHIFSGLNDPGEVLGALQSGVNFGITANEIRKVELNGQTILDLIEQAAGSGGKLFIDSGAFSEIDFHDGPQHYRSKDPKKQCRVYWDGTGCAGGPPTVNRKHELKDPEWQDVFRLYLWAAELWRGSSLYVVAPDRIADQAHTLMLQNRYRYYVQLVEATVLERSARVNIIVPVQKGRMSMTDFWAAELDALQLRHQPICGIPLKKDATSPAELFEFAETTPFYGTRFHLLGKGPASEDYDELIYGLKAIRPQCEITTDSTHRRWIGSTNGPGGGPRKWTREIAVAKARGEEGPAAKRHAMTVVQTEEYDERMLEARRRGWIDEDEDP